MNDRRTRFRFAVLGNRPSVAAALLLLVFCLAAAPATAAAPGRSASRSPAEVVRRLYQAYDRRSQTGRDFFSKKTGKRELAEYFDPRLTDLLWRGILHMEHSGEADPIDFDLLYDAQDTQITGFAVGPPRVEGNQATVRG